MIIETTNPPEFISALRNHVDKTLVILYYCPICFNKQSTAQEKAQILFRSFEDYQQLTIDCTCTSCGMNAQVIYAEDIFGLEII